LSANFLVNDDWLGDGGQHQARAHAGGKWPQAKALMRAGLLREVAGGEARVG